MAEISSSPDNHPIPAAEPNWPDLLSRTVNDVDRIAKTEIGLLEASLKRLIEAQTEKLVGMLFLLVTLVYGSLFLLGGIVLVIHLWLAWWLSFLITGAFVIASGVAFQMAMFAAAHKTSS
jgi:hypothetical protein